MSGGDLSNRATLEALRRQFPICERQVYLNHAAIGPMPRQAVQRMCELVERVARTGDESWHERMEEVERVRVSTARLMGASRPEEIAFVANTGAGLSVVAAGLDWHPGDAVITATNEYPSNLYPWLLLRERGVEVIQIPERAGRIDPEELLAAMDERTRVVALSWVEYSTGFRTDLARIGSGCRERGIFFVVDVIQGLGALRLGVVREHVDVCAGAVHKWLLGPEGLGLLYVGDHVLERLRPVSIGARSAQRRPGADPIELDWSEGARRFESGTLNIAGIVGFGASLDLLLEFGPDRIERRLLELRDRIASGLIRLGFTLVSSQRESERSAIVTATMPEVSMEDLVDRLAAEKIAVAVRLGRLRVAPHIYNTESEIDRLLEVLADLVK